MLARLGDASQAEEMRREKAEAALASDMAAFKAANPGCCIEDFVRWHSPKDWRPTANGDASGAAQPSASAVAPSQGAVVRAASDAETVDAAEESSVASKRRRDGRRGELSVRMRHRNNRWQRIWKVAHTHRAHCSTPQHTMPAASRDWAVADSLLCCLSCAAAQSSPALPAFEQVPLFDCLTVGEKTLNDLEHVQPQALFSQLAGVAASNFLSAMARTPPALNDLADCRSRIAAVQGAVQSPSTVRPAGAGGGGAPVRSRHLPPVLLPPLSAPHRPPPCRRKGAGEGAGGEGGHPLRLCGGGARPKGSTSRANSSGPQAVAAASPKPDRRSYTLFAPTRQPCPPWATACTSTSSTTETPRSPRTQRRPTQRQCRRPPPPPPTTRRPPLVPPLSPVASATSRAADASLAGFGAGGSSVRRWGRGSCCGAVECRGAERRPV